MKTINDLIITYLEHLRSLRYSPETLRGNRFRLTAFAKWLLTICGVVEISRLKVQHLERWHDYFSSKRSSKGYPLKATSINCNIISVRMLLDYLAKNGYVRSGLLASLPKLKEPHHLPGGTLTHAQVKRLLARLATDSPEGHRNRTILELLYSTGIRANELLGLNLNDIDRRSGTALVRGKGDKERIVPVGKTALRFLESYLTAIRPFLLRTPTEKALFLGRDGCRLSYAAFRRMIVATSGHANLEDVTAHTFRRSCTTELLRSGANMYHVKELLGHESLDTLRHYAKLTINDLKKTHKKCHPREREMQ